MAHFLYLALAFGGALLVVLSILLSYYLFVCWNIRREDRFGTATGQAPTRGCQVARNVTGLHSMRMA
jgi:hypothetical protein